MQTKRSIFRHRIRLDPATKTSRTFRRYCDTMICLVKFIYILSTSVFRKHYLPISHFCSLSTLLILFCDDWINPISIIKVLIENDQNYWEALAQFYLHSIWKDPRIWRIRCGAKRRQTGQGNSILSSHLREWYQK